VSSRPLSKAKEGLVSSAPAALLRDLRDLIARARERVARQVNEELVALYWNVGKRIREDLLKSKQAEYGKQIVSAVGRELSAEFGDGFSEKNLRHMIRGFARGSAAPSALPRYPSR
jgi:hypothetical protein